jgi:putative MATE family efflux protein
MYKFFNVEKGFFSYLLKLAVPITVSSLLQVAVQTTDVVMISHYSSEIGVASINLAGQVFLNLLLVFWGLATSAAIFFSRYWGAKNFKAMQQLFGLTLSTMLIFVVLGSLLFITKSTFIMGFMTNDREVIEGGALYLRITAFSFVGLAFSIAIATYLRSVEKSHYPMWIALCTTLINILLNYLLIFGNFGFSAMGVKGAAIATVIVRTLDALAHIVLFLSSKNPIPRQIANYFSIFSRNTLPLIKTFFTIALPVLITDVSWALAITAYKKAYAKIGTGAVAAFAAMESFYQLFMVLFVGLGVSAAIIIGIELGKHNQEGATKLANFFIKFNFVLAIPLGLIMFFLSPLMVTQVMKFEGETAYYTIWAIRLCGLFLSFRALEFLLSIGILRAGGDAYYFMLIQIVTLWCIGVPLVFIAVNFLTTSPIVLFLIVLGEEVVRDVWCYLRFKSGRWIKSL